MNYRHRHRQRVRSACDQAALEQSAWSLEQQVREARETMGPFKWRRLNEEFVK